MTDTITNGNTDTMPAVPGKTDYAAKRVASPVHERVLSSVSCKSALQQDRLHYIPRINPLLKGAFAVKEGKTTTAAHDVEVVRSLFPALFGQPILNIQPHSGDGPTTVGRRLRIGVVLSGGPAPGGHNIITGLHDYLSGRNSSSLLVGFLGGPSGIVDGEYVELDADAVAPYRNQGGFHMIGSGRTKISQPEQYESARRVVKALALDGLVVAGGDDSNTNAMLLAEDFKTNNIPCCVVGCPKTIDNDLRSAEIETAFGFDTATKVYSNLIANLGHDAVSARKTYHVVRVMGRSASHIALECALQTRPNLCFIGEEVKQKGTKLTEVVKSFANLVCNRAAEGKNYGLVIMPEGLVEFMPDVEALIAELNEILATKNDASFDDCAAKLSPDGRMLFTLLPRSFADQLMLERDPHGNVQVAKIEVERLVIDMVIAELALRKESGEFAGKFIAVPHYEGYNGRCALPSNFDTNYCYGLGHVAGALIDEGRTGYIATLSGLTKKPEKWMPAGYPLTMMMNIERRKGRNVPVIKKMLVDLNGTAFKIFKSQRNSWKLHDDYRNPGPIQHWGPSADDVTMTLSSEEH